MPARYQLLSPWPREALAFATAVERVARLVARARTSFASNFELTIPGWRLLRLAARPGRPPTLTRAARGLHVTRPTAREAAERLARIGYLSIGPPPGDRRARALTVTEAGHEALSELDGVIQFLLLEVTNDVPRADLEAATRILAAVAARIAACETILRPPSSRRCSR